MGTHTILIVSAIQFSVGTHIALSIMPVQIVGISVTIRVNLCTMASGLPAGDGFGPNHTFSLLVSSPTWSSMVHCQYFQSSVVAACSLLLLV